MEQYYGLFVYGLSLLTMGGIYAVMALGLNVQWGFTGLFNAGIAGFFAVGAYTQAILTTPICRDHLGCYDVPIPLAMLVAMVFSAAVAWAIAKICIRLRSDYLAIATIGIAEILRLAFKNEIWATNGPRGVSQIPKAFETLPGPWNALAFLGMVAAVVGVVYLALEKARTAPWGRVMTAIRENETAAAAAGKNVERNVSDPLTATFLVWVMLVAGGPANNKGAVLGAVLIYVVWSGSELLSTRFLTLLSSDSIGVLTHAEAGEWSIRFAYLRVFIIGLILQVILQMRPQGILPEVRPKPHPRQGGDQAPGVTQGSK